MNNNWRGGRKGEQMASRIADLGVIGNCRSAALIDHQGTIVWNCLPDFDSTSVFASLLDSEKGGAFSILPEPGTVISQSYLKNTCILRTLFSAPDGVFELLDFMPLYITEGDEYYQAPEIYRYIRVLSGNPSIRIEFTPRLNYALSPTETIIQDEFIKSFTSSGDYHSIYLYSSISLQAVLAGQPVKLSGCSFFLVSYHQKLVSLNSDLVHREYERTQVYWLNWAGRTAVYPRYQEEIVRSALTLKLLTYNKTGAVIAAVTTSLPESPGETRNWDYRFCWLRDSAMIIRTLTELNHSDTASRFLKFLLNTMIHKAETLQILYGIRGEKNLTEKNLGHLSGYLNSRPVRIGNAAYEQKQNDVYGVLMDLIYTSLLKFPGTQDEVEELWTTVRAIVKFVSDGWHKPDRGIWEIRKEHRHFVFSKVLSWVALDRAVRTASLLGRESAIPAWTALRDQIRNDIEEKGWNSRCEAYTQSYGSSDLDSSILLMERLGYCGADDPRYRSTVKAIYTDLCQDGLMYRYRNRDDFGKPSSAFTICTFWMIDALYRTGQQDLAVSMFNSLLKSTNRLGLLSEDMDFKTRELLGNFPQGYSHLALVNTAILLNGGSPGEKTVNFVEP